MKPIILTTCFGLWLSAGVAVLAQNAPAPVPADAAAIDASNSPGTNDNQDSDTTPQPPDDSAQPTNSAAPSVAPATPSTPPAVIPPAPAPVTTNAIPSSVPPAGSSSGLSNTRLPINGANSAASTNAPPLTPEAAKTVTLPNGELGLVFNFHGAPLQDVLNYMSDAAGFIIHPKTDVRGKVDVWSAKPVTKTEAVKLLTDMLHDNNYSVIQDGRELTIWRTSDVKNQSIPVMQVADPDKMPKTANVATVIVPVHTINAVALAKNLEMLKPSDMTITSDESANSIVMTDTEEHIHHMMEIIHALDTVTSSASAVKVYPLKYADSKALASLIKDLYPNPDTQRTGTGGGFGGGMFGRMMRGGGGFGGPGGFGGNSGGDNSDSGNGHTPTAKVNAVSDDHSNSLIVTAPEGLIGDIDILVSQVDTPVEDTTMIQSFHLRNADAGEMADLLTSLFPADNGSSDATRTSPFGFGRFGGPFAAFGGQQNNGKSNESDRMKKMAQVIAVADRRTSTLVVTCGTNMMPQIAELINDLDKDRARVVYPVYYPIANAEVLDVLQNLQDTFQSTSISGKSSSSTTTTSQNALLTRQQTILQQQNSQTTTSSFGSGGTSGRGIGN